MIRLDNVGELGFTKEDFERFIYEWNINYPIDRYYRKKYNLRFNSPDHRVSNFIDMAFEYFEDKIYEFKKEHETGDYLKERKGKELSDEEMIALFNGENIKGLDDGR